MRTRMLLPVALVGVVVATFYAAGDCAFVAYDDPAYVAANPLIHHGLRWAGVEWALTSVHGGNWHPLTSFCHMLDCSLSGLEAGAQHWWSVIWHALNVLLVWAVWRRWRGSGEWQAAAVAAVFAVHPLRVESVAWISDRKDLVCGAMWLGTLLAYLRYAERPSGRRAALVAAGTTAALMAKPVAVALPFSLLLMDFWPLERWRERPWGRLLAEKALLFLLAGGAAVATVLAQGAAGATEYAARLSAEARIGNALVSVVRYVGKALWPGKMAPFYPHPGMWPWATVMGAAALIGGVSLVAWRQRQRRPWLAWGWMWFLVTLAPSLGLVQVGAQAMADRYLYVPLLGLLTIGVWGGAELIRLRPSLRQPAAAVLAVVVVLCAIKSARQVRVWRDSISLAEQIRAVAGEHPVARREMGAALAYVGRPAAEVAEEYRQGLALEPDNAFFLNELGQMAAREGRFEEALALLQRLVAAHGENAGAWTNLASVQVMAGQLDVATESARTALRRRADHADARRVLAQIYVRQNRLSDARAELEQAVREDRWSWVLHNELGVVLIGLGRREDGIRALERAVWIHPSDVAARENLRVAAGR